MNLSEYVKINTLSQKSQKIDASNFLLEHASDIDSILYKYSLYTSNINNKLVNESIYNESFSLSEQVSANNLLQFVCEEYIDSLTNELTIYEHFYNDTLDEYINEGLGDLFKKSKEVINTAVSKGKSWVSKQIDSLKIKIKEIKEFLSQLANDAIKSVKDMTEKLMSLLDKFDCTIKGLFEKIGIFNIDKLETSWNDNALKIADQIKANPKAIQKFKIYESWANDLKNNDLIVEDEENKEGTAINQTGEDKGGWKKALWDAFKQLAIWATVCVAIPGVVIAAFPGTFIALLVPLVCKLAWNGYKIVKLWKQFKKVKSEWNTYGKIQKWITVLSMVGSLVALFFNFKSLFDNLGPVLEGLQKSGFDVLSKANLGIQPDALQRGFAAVITMLKEGKFSMDDFKASYDAISESFSEHVFEKVTKTVTNAVKKGQDGAEFIKNNFEKGQFKKPIDFWNKAKSMFMDPSEISDDGTYDVVADGFLKGGSGGNAWSDKAIAIAKEMGMEKYLNPERGLNKGLNAIFSGQGSVTGFRMPGKLLKALSDAGCLGNKNMFGIVGSIVNTVTQTTVIQDIAQAASSMLVTIPSVELAPENNGGFRIRLGEKGSKNYVYEVGKDDVRVVKKSDHTEDYENIKKTIVDNNVEYMKQILESSKKDDNIDDKEIKDKLKEFKEHFEKEIDNGECILIYGKKVDEETNESYTSLRDYLIMEGTTVAQIQKNLFDPEYDKSPEKSSNSSTSIYHYLYEPFKYWNKQLAAKKSGKKAGEKIDASDTKANTSHGEELVSLGKKILNKVFNGEYISSDEYNLIVSLYLGQKGQKFGPIIGEAKKDNPESTKDGRLNDLFVRIIELTKKLKENKGSKLDGKSGQANDEIKLLYNSIIRILSHVKDWEIDVKNKKVTTLKIQVSDENAKKAAEQLKKHAKEKLPDDNTSTKDVTDSIEKNDDIPDELKDEIVDVVKAAANEVEPEEDTSTDDPIEGNDNSNDDNGKASEDDGKVKPIMIFVYGYGKDLANADKSGPRKDPYSMKGLFNTCEIITIEGGTSEDNLSKMFGGIFREQIIELYNVLSYKPCNEKNELDDNAENDKERPELANLTNAEAADILKNDKNAVKMIKNGTKVSAAETPDEKKQLEQLQKTNSDAVKNDKELQNELEQINPDLIDDNGNLNEKEWNRTNDMLSEYQLSKHKEKSHKGFFGKIWSAIKNFFSTSKDYVSAKHKYTEKELEKIANLIYNKVKKDRKIKESYDDNDVVMLIKPKSLSKYILENRNR